MTKILNILLYILIVILSPILVWLVLIQLCFDFRIWHNQRLYRNKQLNNRIFARKCEVKQVTDKKLVKKFVRENHTFGFFITLFYLHRFNKHKIIGLYYENKLVFVACFKTYKNRKDLFNYATCSLCNVSVAGGASRCMKHVGGLISTISLDTSTLYETLGFKENGKCNLFELIFNIHTKSGSFKYWIKDYNE